MFKKYIETEKVIEAKDKLLALMDEYVEEVRGYSESSIDYHGGRADGMKTAMMFLRNNFDKLLESSSEEEASNKITIKDFANRLNGRRIGQEITREEAKEAKDLGFVVVFGYSDDNAEFRGAIEDEVDCFDGGRVFDRYGKYIDAVWCEDGFSWIYNTNIKHETFEIIEDDGCDYCRGIVFKYDSIFDL